MTRDTLNLPDNEPQRQKLLAALAALRVDIVDNSWRHAGHAANTGPGVGTHLAIHIVSPAFDGMPLLDRHREVHCLLADEMRGALHALELRLETPSEAGACANTEQA